MKNLLIVFGLVLFLVAGANAEILVTTLIDDGFDDGGRTDGVDALDADWWEVYDYTLGIDPNGGLGDGYALSIVGDGSSLAVANFENQTLVNDGDMVIFSFDLQLLGGLANDNIRFGLLDSGGTLVNSDVTVDDMADDDHSYFIRLSTGTVQDTRIYQDTGSTSPMGGSGISNKADGPFGVGNNEVHSIKITYAYVGGDVKIDFVLDEGTAGENSLSWTDNLDPIMNYAEAGILIRQGMSALVDNVVVEFARESNLKPTVDAGVSQYVLVGDSYQLASNSSDPEGLSLSYLWTATGPGTATFTDDGITENPTVSFDTVGIYTLELAVSDGVLSATDSVTLMVYPEGWNGELAHMSYDTDAADESIWGNEVTVIGNPTYSTSPQSNTGAIEFDGVDDCLEYDPNLASNVTDLTFMCWARRDSAADVDMEIAGNYPNYDGQEQGWRLFFDNGGYFKLWMGEKHNIATYFNVKEAIWTAGQWVHVAMTFEYNGGSGNRVRFYINGVQELDATTNYEAFPNSTIPFVVGRRTTGGSFLDGAIDDLYLFGRALGQEEIVELADLPNTPPVVDAGESKKIIQPASSVELVGLVTDLEDDASGAVFSAVWSVVDYDPNITVSFAPVDDLSTTVTFTGNEEFSAAGDYLLRLTVTDSLGMSDSDELVVRVRPEGFDGLEAHIQFENADPQLAVNSTVGIGYEGTIYGDPNAGFDVPDAKVGSGALQLFGQEYVEYSTLLGALDSITVSVWVNCPDYEVGGRIIQKWSADSSGNGWFLRIRNGNTNDANPAGLIGSGYNSDGNFQTAWYGITVNNEWAHVVLTFEDGVQRLWVNGALQDEDTEVEFSPEDMYTQVAIGRRTNNDSEYFQGLIDEVRIYDYALSIDEVKALYVADGGDPSWDKCPEGSSGLAGDLTGDCKVDLQDLAVLGADWQSVYSTGTLATVAQEWLDCDSFDLLDCF